MAQAKKWRLCSLSGAGVPRHEELISRAMPTPDSFRTLLVANPQSANGALGRKWPQLQRTIAEQLGPFEHRFTRGPKDATALTREALAEGRCEMVVAMGGDGTFSEVVSGFFTPDGPVRPDAVLGVLPFGTGGDFRKTIGAPKELAQGARSLVGRRTRAIDVGRLTYTTPAGETAVHHFLNIASFGIGGLVDELVNTSSKALGGRVSFALATARAMWRYHAQRAAITLDGGVPREVSLHNVAVANGQYFGGGMHIAPEAKIDDGLFDVVTLGPMTMADLLLRGHRVYAGTHLSLPSVSLERARRVEARPVDPADRILLDVDGEAPGMLPATFELIAGALRLKTPET
jgi:YegS/Rv2252/BmrU family lipid kinase